MISATSTVYNLLESPRVSPIPKQTSRHSSASGTPIANHIEHSSPSNTNPYAQTSRSGSDDEINHVAMGVFQSGFYTPRSNGEPTPNLQNAPQRGFYTPRSNGESLRTSAPDLQNPPRRGFHTPRSDAESVEIPRLALQSGFYTPRSNDPERQQTPYERTDEYLSNLLHEQRAEAREAASLQRPMSPPNQFEFVDVPQFVFDGDERQADEISILHNTSQALISNPNDDSFLQNFIDEQRDHIPGLPSPMHSVGLPSNMGTPSSINLS